MREHRAQALGVDDPARQVAQLVAHMFELALQPRRGGSGRPQSAPDCVLVIGNHVVELTERALLFDLDPEARRAGTCIAFEDGDGGMLVLDLAGYIAERPVCDMPCERSPELSRRETPRAAIHMRNRWLFAGTFIEMRAKVIDERERAASQFVSVAAVAPST